jgi:hypothetical protein
MNEPAARTRSAFRRWKAASTRSLPPAEYTHGPALPFRVEGRRDALDYSQFRVVGKLDGQHVTNNSTTLFTAKEGDSC